MVNAKKLWEIEKEILKDIKKKSRKTYKFEKSRKRGVTEYKEEHMAWK